MCVCVWGGGGGGVGGVYVCVCVCGGGGGYLEWKTSDMNQYWGKLRVDRCVSFICEGNPSRVCIGLINNERWISITLEDCLHNMIDGTLSCLVWYLLFHSRPHQKVQMTNTLQNVSASLLEPHHVHEYIMQKKIINWDNLLMSRHFWLVYALHYERNGYLSHRLMHCQTPKQ